MDNNIALIGFGEAGSTFAKAGNWAGRCVSYDRLFDDIKAGAVLLEAAEQTGVSAANGFEQLFKNAGAAAPILSLVTADQAGTVAESCAEYIREGQLFLDMNSVAPATKIAAAEKIAGAGARYVDVAIMSPVNPKQMDVPLFVSGPDAANAAKLLGEIGFSNILNVGDEVGRASTIKMLRSVIYKGMEALTAECLIACAQAGVVEEVIGSFEAGWADAADYKLDRMMVHGARRSAEMAEAVKTLKSLGVDPLMTRGTVQRQAEIGARAIASPPAGLKAKLEVLDQ